MKFRFSVALILISFTLGIPLNAYSAEDVVTYNLYPIAKAFSKSSNNLTTSSYLKIITKIETDTASGRVTYYSQNISPRCETETAVCVTDFKRSVHFSSVLPVCTKTNQKNCIESVVDSNSDLQFVEYSDGIFWNENAEYNLPVGASTSIWASNDRLFAATVRLQQDQPIPSWDTTNLTVELSEIVQVNEDRNDVERNISQRSINISRLVWLDDPDLASKVTPDLYRKLLSTKTGSFELSAKVRVGEFVPKWNLGQLQNASIKLSKNAGYNLVEFIGTSVEVPIPTVRVPLSQDQIFRDENPFLVWWYFDSNLIERNLLPSFYGNGGTISAFSQTFNGFSEKWEMSSKSSPRTWRVESFASSPDVCIQKSSGVVGSLFTNANSYPNSFPSKVGDSFDFLIKSTHLKNATELNNGYYQLDVKQETVKCLLRTEYLPVSAELNVIDELGQSKVATTSSRLRSGYFNLVASNFTYSAPNIRVKFETAKRSPLKTITCIKGKQMKKVTGAKPVCPVGYKRK